MCHSRRLTALAVVGCVSHLAFFGIAAVRVCMQLEAVRATLGAAFVLLCAAAVAARGRLLWCRCCNAHALRELDLQPAPRPWALDAVGVDDDEDDADAAGTWRRIRRGAAVEMCAANGSRYKAWVQLSDDLSTLRWGWDRRSIELERLNGVWLGVGFKAGKLGQHDASRRKSGGRGGGGGQEESLSCGQKEAKEGKGKMGNLVRTATANALTADELYVHDKHLLTLLHGTVVGGLRSLTIAFADGHVAADWARGLRARQRVLALPMPAAAPALAQTLARIFEVNDTEGDGYLPEAGVTSALRSLGLTLGAGRDSASRTPSLRTLLSHLSPHAPPLGGKEGEVVDLPRFVERLLWLRRGMMVSNVADGMLLPPGHASGDSALESRHVLLSTATFKALWTAHQASPPP